MIECDLLPIVRKYFKDDNKKPKHGVYCQNWFWAIKGYAKKKWVVGVKIDLDYEAAQKQWEDDETIVKECVKFLNTPPKSKYGKVRKRKTLYGDFDPAPYSFQIKEDSEGKKYISARLITSQQKNKKFHGSGPGI
jgi:hypothetical protein